MRKYFLSLVFIFAACHFAFAQVPTLGTYPATTIATAGNNITVIPSAGPTAATSTTAYTSANFKGLLHVNPVNGVLSIINAHPAGIYPITVKAFNGVSTATTTFSLTVNNTACSQALFSSVADINIGYSPNVIAISDFNNDGKQDFAVINDHTTGAVFIRLGNGAGAFTAVADVNVGSYPKSLATGDFNGDGRQDLAVANYSSNTVSIRLGNGAGGFSGTGGIAVGASPSAIAVSDFNSDGNADFAVANGNEIVIKYGDGTGAFSGNTVVSMINGALSLAVGDFNGDGKTDLVTANYLVSGSVSIRLGDGAGGFGTITQVNVGSYPNSVLIVDVNADGKPDIATANNGDGTVSVRINDGMGGFTGNMDIPVGAGPYSIVSGDFNGDGKTDLATANRSAKSISLRLGDGTGNFNSSAEIPMVNTPYSMAVGNFNGDNQQDFATANAESNVSVDLGRPDVADISVQGNNINIASGDVTPTIADHTDFGNVDTSLTRTFTIRNPGTGNLTIKDIRISGADSSMFTAGGITLPATVTASSFTTFTIQFIPTATGHKMASVRISSNDCNIPLYDFAVQGAGNVIVPNVISYPATTITRAGGNIIITPTAVSNATKITATTSPAFKGVLQADPATGKIRVTNAYPVGTYMVTVTNFYLSSASSTTFTLTVNNNLCGNFGGTVSKPEARSPTSIAIGDFNNDGKQDIATAIYQNSGTVSIRLGNGTGGFGDSLIVSVGLYPTSVALADFNGDGKLDFATTNSYSNNVSIRLGNGTGGFPGNIQVNTGNGPGCIAIADFNSDGKPDFATANSIGTISVRMGDGTGNFIGTTEVATGYSVGFLTVADFNNDGKQDIAATNYNNGLIFIKLGDGMGGFSGTTTVSTDVGPAQIAAGDFNGDGNIDIITPNTPRNNVSVRFGNGAGGFTGTANLAVPYSPSSISIADFNGDGLLDFAAATYGSLVAIRYGDGAGNFSGSTNVSAGVHPRTLAIGDFNADGKLDFAAADNNESSSAIAVCLGSANEINIQSNNTTIVDGSNIPGTADSTEFGNVGNITHQYTIQNSGVANLTIHSITFSGADTSAFAVEAIVLPAVVNPGSAVTFNVRFLPVSTGLKTATVNIYNDDCDETIYNFNIQGTGVLPAIGTYPATTIATASGTATIMPSAAPLNTALITAYTSTNFKGLLNVDLSTGKLIVTNAHPAGTYIITVKAFNGVLTVIKTFTLTIGNTYCSQGLFSEHNDLKTTGHPASVVVGDFNSDGKQDLVTATNTGIFIQLGDGAGNFSGATNVYPSFSSNYVAVGDFNGDGKQDLAVTSLPSNVTILTGDGNGNFSLASQVDMGYYVSFIITGDFNGDGKLDFAASGGVAYVSVHINDGLGGFNKTATFLFSCSAVMAKGDFNRDGKTDLAVAVSYNSYTTINQVFILTGNGLGGFTNTFSVPVGAGPSTILTADFNKDGYQDLVTGGANVTVLFGNGTGGFSGVAGQDGGGGGGGNPSMMAVGDFNGDGNEDLARTNYIGSYVEISYGIGAGGSAKTVYVGVKNAPSAIAIGDFNGDGTQDFVTSHTIHNSAAYYVDSISVRLGGINEISVQGNHTNIAAGDLTPDSTDHTDFGNVGSSLTRKFTIYNTGTGKLNLNNITISGADSSRFFLSNSNLYTVINPGDSVTFTITFVPTTVGLKTTKVRISNDHCTKPLYEFAIQGTGVIITPTLGNYRDTVIVSAGGNITIAPSAPPTNAINITAFTTTNFKGILQVNPVTGVLNVTNAHPAGTYLITVKVSGLASAISNFQLTVGDNKCSQGLFLPSSNLNGINYPHSVAIGDFNNDGKQDFAIGTYGNTVAIRLGDGAGNFSSAPDLSIGSLPYSSYTTLAAADFNGDGYLDLAAANDGGRSDVTICLGNGTGSFVSSASVAINSHPLSIATGDFNGDGKPDFATANGATVSICLGNGAGGFSPATGVPVGSLPYSITIGDLNSDGKQDFAVANYNDNNVSIRLGNGSGGFISAANVPVGLNPQSVVIEDFNGDGNPDLATANAGDNTVSIRLGNGTGNFSGTIEIPVGNGPEFIRAGDFNGDGKTDFVTANYSNNTVSIRLGSGTGTFTGINNVTVGANPQALALADFNADGKSDIVTANFNNTISPQTTSSVSVLLGSENEINVQGNNINIADNSTAPDSSNYTDFGNVSSSRQRTFTIQNTGLTNLTISNIRFTGADSSLFSLANFTLPTTIAAGANASFTVTFAPTGAGLKTATIIIHNDDCDEALYDFALQGTGVIVMPLLGNYPATTIATSGGNTTVTPSSAPVSAVNISAYTSPVFKGVLHVNPVTGILTITNAYPAGNYIVTIKVNGVATVTTSFSLTVNNPNCSLGQFVSASIVQTNPNLNGYNPISIAVGDFNGDGKQDLVSANAGSNTVAVRINNGAGVYNGTLNVAVGTTPYSVAVCDFNGDGNQDFITANYGSNNVSIRLGNGSGGFTGLTSVNVGTNPSSIVIADFNSDGKVDFATANAGSNNVSVYTGNGEGSFNGMATVAVGNSPMSITVADFNQDGKPDFAVANSVSNTVSIRFGNGTGGFTGITDLAVGNSPQSIIAGDFNNDGKPDVATANYNSNTISAFLGNGLGSFTGAANVVVGTAPSSIAVGDFNGDGKQDLITANYGNNTVSIRLGDGTGGFSGTANRALGNSPRSIVIGDFDKNGIQDFSVAYYTNHTLSIFLGSDKEINVKGNNTSIADGKMIADSTDNTHFGTTIIGSSLTRTFTIQNTGSFNLTVSNITLTGLDSLAFSKAGITLPTTITPGASATFTVTFLPASKGIKNAIVNILNDDCDESLYDFAIRGVASCPPSSATNVWLGNSADWNLAGNWSLSFVPTECTKVVVNSGVPFMPEITTPNSVCYSLTLNNSATITVKSGGHLNITANN